MHSHPNERVACQSVSSWPKFLKKEKKILFFLSACNALPLLTCTVMIAIHHRDYKNNALHVKRSRNSLNASERAI